MSECVKHQWYAPKGTYSEVHPPCPWCQIAELKGQLEAAEQHVKILRAENATCNAGQIDIKKLSEELK